jgi:hypothetical protein
MKMRIRHCSLTKAAWFVLLAWPTLAGTRGASAEPRRAPLASQEEPMNFTLQGTITKLEAETFIVSTEENIIFHVRHNDKTSIKHADGTAASVKDLLVGTKVRVEGDLTESGENVAKKIEIQQAGGSKPPPR